VVAGRAVVGQLWRCIWLLERRLCLFGDQSDHGDDLAARVGGQASHQDFDFGVIAIGGARPLRRAGGAVVALKPCGGDVQRQSQALDGAPCGHVVIVALEDAMNGGLGDARDACQLGLAFYSTPSHLGA